jgi:glycine cleavage system regulatory protein
MHVSIIMTVLAADRPGLVSTLSETIAACSGSWQESRMARLAGQFAGILRIECPADQATALLDSLAALESHGISVLARREETSPEAPRETVSLDIVGNDRPGIIRALSAAIAATGGNVEDLSTSLESAPMSGHPIFHARGVVALAADGDASGLIAAIENLGPDLSVSIER